jgi:esterase/lipase superfamily enzyme
MVAALLTTTAVDSFGQCFQQQSDPFALQSRLEATQARLDDATAAERATPAFRALQEQALMELEALQCAEADAAPPEAVKRGPGLDTPFAVVPVLSITDRKRIVGIDGRHQFFGPERSESGVAYDRLVVRLPGEHYTAGDTLPVGVTIADEKDSRAGVSVGQPTAISRDELGRYLRTYRATLPPRAPLRVLLFVHGFNVSYPEAVRAVARLAFALRINVLPVALSWPSQAAILKYWNDEENIEPSVERFRPVLQALLSDADVDEVIVVAHSMGSRLFMRIVSYLQLQPGSMSKLARVSLAAADLGEAEIRELWPRLRKSPAKGWLFYTSANDFALRASSIVHASPPVGDSRKRIFTVPEFETVDASAVAPLLRGYGHSYVIDNPALSVDLRRWVSQGLQAQQRGLSRGTRHPAVFWSLEQR